MLTREKVPILFRTQWSPLSLPNLALWLDPVYGLYQERTGASATTPATADGDPVGTWVGRVYGGGLVYCTAPSDAARPTLRLAVQNGRSVVRFDGVDDYLSVNAVASVFTGSDTPYELTGVVKNCTASGGQILNCGSSTDVTPLIHHRPRETGGGIANFRRPDTGSSVYVIGSATGAGGFILGWAFSGTTITHRINGVADAAQSSDIGTITLDMVTIGATNRSGGPSEFLDGDVGELALASAVLSAENRTALWSYLNSRWGVY